MPDTQDDGNKHFPELSGSFSSIFLASDVKTSCEDQNSFNLLKEPSDVETLLSPFHR